jgi:hypothetical protein
VSSNSKKMVRPFEGIENLEDFLEIFEAFAGDLINQLAKLTHGVQSLQKSFNTLAQALEADKAS